MKDLRLEGPLLGQGALCEPIFAALPDWFGIEEANRQYVTAIDDLPTFVVMEEGRALGFLTLKLHFPWAAEIYVMGVRPETHRRGIGRALLHACEAKLGVPRSRLTVRISNQAAISMYEKEGYATTEIWNEYYNDGEDGMVMEKTL